MNYLLIENKGEIDVNALILMGGSTKRGDETKIGHFGSGNKYAIALLLKHGIDFIIFSGNQEIVFETEKVTFRDKSFDKIKINGRDTSLTTDMGPQWDIWQAVREFVSNAIDEGDYNIVDRTSNIDRREGYTRVYLPHTPAIKEVVDHWESYFSFDRTDELLSVDGCKVYPHFNGNEGLLLYRRGIRCFKEPLKSLFQYDIKDFVINESRVIENSYSAKTQVVQFLSKNVSVDIARRFLLDGYKSEFWEANAPWYIYTTSMHPNWLTAIGNHILIVDDVAGWYQHEQAAFPHFLVRKEFARTIRKYFPQVKIYGLRESAEAGLFRGIATTSKITYMLGKAQEFFKETGYEIGYPIVVGQFDTDTQLGGIGSGEIQLSEKVFDMGVKELVMTIIEENEHLKTNYLDCSREFQHHWIKLYVTEKEERFAYFL